MHLGDTLWCLIVLLLFALHHASSQMLQMLQMPAHQVQLHEHRISQHKDREYVRQIMRRAKSAEMRAYMRPEVDACDNFFEFSCGNWAKINPTDSTTAQETNFFQLITNTYNLKQLKLLQAGKQQNDSEVHVKVKNFYDACQGIAQKPLQYKSRLREIIAEFGQMPALLVNNTDFEQSEFNWLTTIAKIQNKLGFGIILELGIAQDFENVTVNKLFIGQPSLKLSSKAMYTSEGTKYHRDNYKLQIQKNLQRYLNVEEKRALETANEILDFEVKLAAGIMSIKLGKTLKSLTMTRTLDELQSAYAPAIDFKQYFNISLGYELNTTFYEYILEYQQNLADVILTTPKQQLANYIMYQLAALYFYNFEESVHQREQSCLNKTKALFAKILDNIIFRKYSNKETESDVNLIWQTLKETFKAQLESEQLDWISLMTRKLSIEKLDAMKLEINSYKNANFTSEYAKLNITEHDYVQNIRQWLEFRAKRAFASLNEAPKPVESAVLFSYSPAHVAKENLIKFPVSLLQPNYLWSDSYPNALKFGTLGYLVAHELIHGFDDMGRNYDIDGNERTWWDASSTQAFNERKSCFKRQYARYRYGGKYLPESELQAENIADNGGVQIAYSAYMNWMAANNVSAEHELLPNLNYTSKQLFFISFAQFWCNDVDARFKDKVALVDSHSPAMYRVIGSLSNFAEFSKEFKCAPGTAMSPLERCKIY